VTQTVEVENSETTKALAEARAKNGSLQEQLLVQRQLLRELETQLHDSQRTCTQLRTQVGSMENHPCCPAVFSFNCVLPLPVESVGRSVGPSVRPSGWIVELQGVFFHKG